MYIFVQCSKISVYISLYIMYSYEIWNFLKIQLLVDIISCSNESWSAPLSSENDKILLYLGFCGMLNGVYWFLPPSVGSVLAQSLRDQHSILSCHKQILLCHPVSKLLWGSAEFLCNACPGGGVCVCTG